MGISAVKNLIMSSYKNYFLKPKISSAEQSTMAHSFAKVVSDGKILPDRYCDSVGFDTPNSFAISVFVFPHVSISSRSLFVIIVSNSVILFASTLLLGIA